MRMLDLSVVVPVYNEEAGLPALFARLYPALDALSVPYEVIFVNDGSRDLSVLLGNDDGSFTVSDPILLHASGPISTIVTWLPKRRYI